ncbi:hypothetical protein V8J88_11405 [Massilia sp. W12]|uniref:hypothetical protein n=1 Tax=Massilia sp. W12 TaxID=3126507 RepID=UPI0030D0675F
MTSRIILLLMAAAATLWGLNYYHSLSVRSLQVVRIEREAQRPHYRNLIYTVQADFPRYPWISERMRRFLALRPVACFVTPDGKELVNDLMQSDCRSNEPVEQTELEAITFALPLFITAPPESFLRDIRQKRGVWVKLYMQAMLLPITVEAEPVFLDIAAFCKIRSRECEGILAPLAN